MELTKSMVNRQTELDFPPRYGVHFSGGDHVVVVPVGFVVVVYAKVNLT